MMAVVCDASVLFKLLVAEPDSDRAFQLAEGNQLIVPEFALLEIGNALWRRVRSGVSDTQSVVRLLGQLQRFDLDIRSVRQFVSPALLLALSLRHPIYDCLYLAMAEALEVRLVTADRRFLSAVRDATPDSIRVTALVDFA